MRPLPRPRNAMLRLLVLALWLLAGPALAQDGAQNSFDFAKWETTATRAEGIIQNSQASSSALETLRATLSDYRSQALALQGANKARTDTLKSQLTALGPAPAKGQSEAPEVAKRRAELTTQLGTAQAPGLAALEAYKRASGLIGELDSIIRERLANQLMTLGVSPLNPSYWPGAIKALGKFSNDIVGEVTEGLSRDAQRVMTQQNLPLTLGLFLLGIMLLTRARRWFLRAFGLVPQGARQEYNEARALLLSTTQVIMPMLGIWAILSGIEATGLIGLRGAVVMGPIPVMALALFGGLWLGRTLFSTTDNTPLFFWLTEEEGIIGQRISALMGIALAADFLLERLAQQTDFPQTATVALSFPIILAAGILLLRMGLLMEPTSDETHSSAKTNPLQHRLYRLLTRSMIVIGAVAPVLAAIGYFTAATALLFPALMTLALLGLILVIFRILIDLADSLLRSSGSKSATADDEQPLTLVPVALGFSLILASLPLLALIWGARVSDLMEIWTMARDGFAIGGRRISVADFLTFAIIFAAGYTATRLAQSALRTTVLPRTRMDAGGRNAILSGTGYIGIFLAAVAAITAAGLNLSSLAIVAGALSVGIGFGLQAVVSNFVSGIILLIEQPIKEGDWIEVGPYSGYVRKISVRSTEIETFDRATVVVPNADFISGTVTNWTHSNMNGRVKVPVGVSYDSDPETVKKILLEIAEAHDMVDHRTHPSVVFLGFGADSLDFEIRAILKDVNYVLSVRSDMNFEIHRRFKAAGVEIPFAQRDINLRNLGELGETLERTFGTAGTSKKRARKKPVAAGKS